MKKRGGWFLLIGILLLAISLFFDKLIFDAILLNGNYFMDIFFGWVSNFGSVFAIMVVVASLFLWAGKKRDWIAVLWSSFIFSFVINSLLKFLVARARPYGMAISYFPGAIAYSFPSLHATVAFSLLPVLNKKFPKLKWFWVLFALLVSYGRVYLGLHYPTDVIAGALLGYAIGSLLVYSEEKYAIFRLSRINMLELRRQMFHICFGIALVVLLNFNILNISSLLVLLLFGVLLSMLSKRFRIPVIYWFLRRFERDDCINKFPGRGIIFYITGALIVLLLFERKIALASMMILALGDPVSHFAGQFGRIGHPLNSKKFIEGAAAGFMVAWLGAILFVNVWQAFLGSLIAMVVEGLEIKLGREQIDDNIVMPLTAGAVIWLVGMLF